MMHLNKKNNGYVITKAATIFTLAIMIAAASIMATPAAATTMTTTTTTSPEAAGLELSPQPVYQERITNQTETPINQTHMQITYSANGTLTLPNTTETINTTSNGSLIVSFITQTAQGKETVTTEDDGNETATATFFDIVRFNLATGEGKGIAMAVVHTDSTGILAPLNGMILAGTDDTKPEETVITLWEWQGGGGNSTDFLSATGGGAGSKPGGDIDVAQ